MIEDAQVVSGTFLDIQFREVFCTGVLQPQQVEGSVKQTALPGGGDGYLPAVIRSEEAISFFT